MIKLKNFPFPYKIKPSDKDEIQICCPFCEKAGKPPDTKYHLYIHLRKKVFHCFRCGKSGKFKTYSQLISILSGRSLSCFEQDWDELISEALSYFDENYTIVNQSKEESINLDLISFPVRKDLTPIAYSYLKSRRVSDKEIEEYSIRVGKSYEKEGRLIRKWKGRVLFPFFERNEIIYLVGRSYTGKEPKYLNSKGNRRDKLFPTRNFREKEIVVCEGIFDALNSKRTAKLFSVATLGKEITEEQVSIISENGVEIVYLALDPDLTIEEWSKNILKFLVKGIKVYPVLLPKGSDVDSIGSKFPYYLDKAIKQDLAKFFLFEPEFLLKNSLIVIEGGEDEYKGQVYVTHNSG